MVGKKWFLLLVAGIFILTASGGTAWAEGNVNLLLGQKNLDADDWEPVDQQIEFGLMMDFKGANWPVSLAFDLLVAHDEETVNGIKFESDTREVNIGLRKYLPVNDILSAYVGGGVAGISAELSGSAGGGRASVDDSAIGFWVGTGLVISPSGSFNFGVDLRFSNAEVTFFDIDGEAGGTHLLAFVGFQF